jgi:hypothetical protein
MGPGDPYETPTSSYSELPKSNWRNMHDEIALRTMLTVKKVTKLRNLGALSYKNKGKWGTS